MKYPLVILITFCLNILTAWSQFSGWGVYDSTNSALPSSLITSVAIGANNKVWIGTNAGLASFEDLIDWNIYTSSNSTLASNWITKVKVDANNQVWYATQNGFLGYFNGSQFVNFTSANSPLGAYTVTDFDFNANVVWVTTNGGGLFKFENNSWQNYNQQNLGLPIDAARCVSVDAMSSKIHFGTYNNGLFSYDGNNWTQLFSLNSNIPLDNISAVFRENSNKMWLGIGVERNDSSLLFVNASGVQIMDSIATNGIKTSNILHVFSDPNSVKWISSNDENLGGLIRYNDTTYSVYRQFSSGIPSNRVYQSAMDDSSNLWIATFRGLAAFNEANQYLSAAPSILQPQQITAWPNPTVSVLQFELPENLAYTCQVYNSIGVQIFQDKKAFFDKGILDVSSLSQGVYYAHFSQGDSTYLLKFIKQ